MFKDIYVPLGILPKSFCPHGVGNAIGAGISATAQHISDGISLINQRETNKANMQMNEANNLANRQNVEATNTLNWNIAQETNALNKQMFERQVEEQWKMWHAQNEYNAHLPATMVNAYREAGINPALAMEKGGSVGSAGSMSVPSAAPAVGATMQSSPSQAGHIDPIDYSIIGNTISSSLSQFVQNLSQMEDIRGKQIDNGFRVEFNRARLDNLIHDLKVKMTQEDINSTTKLKMQEELSRLIATKESYIKEQQFNAFNAEITNRVLQEQALNLAAERTNMEFQQKLAAARFNLDQVQSKAVVAEIYRRMASMDVNDRLTEKNIEHVAAQSTSEVLKAYGIVLDNNQKEEFAKTMSQRYVEEVKSLSRNNEPTVIPGTSIKSIDLPSLMFGGEYLPESLYEEEMRRMKRNRATSTW